jgi:hypothetical protein
MAHRRAKAKSHRTARVPIPDEELIARLEEKAPEVLSAEISEAAFDAVVEELLRESPSLRDGPHFYRKCREYHLKTHPHYQLASSRHKKNY